MKARMAKSVAALLVIFAFSGPDEAAGSQTPEPGESDTQARVSSLPSSAPPNATDALAVKVEAFRRDCASYEENLREEPTVNRYSDRGELWKFDTVDLDKELRELIVSAVRDQGSFEAAREYLSAEVNWQEIPARLTVSRALKEQHGPPAMSHEIIHGLPGDCWPAVLFRTTTVGDGGSLSVLHHVFWSVSGKEDYLRMRILPYALHASPVSVKTCEIMPDYMSGASIDCSYITTDVVDMGDTLPWIFVMDGPVGHGRFVRLYTRRFDAIKGEWAYAPGGYEWEDVDHWAYDADSRQLTFDIYHGSTDPYATHITQTVDLTEKIREWKTRWEEESSKDGKSESPEPADPHNIEEDFASKELQAAIDDYKAAQADLARETWDLFKKPKPPDTDTDALHQALIDESFWLSRQLQDLIALGIRVRGSFEKARDALSSVVDFKDIPADTEKTNGLLDWLCVAGKAPSTLEERVERQTVVWVQHFRLPSGAEYFLLQDMQPCGHHIVPVSICLVASKDGDVKLYPLPQREDKPYYIGDMYYVRFLAAPLFLTADAMPEIVAVTAWQGAAADFALSGFIYDSQDGQYEPVLHELLSGDWILNQEKATLEYVYDRTEMDGTHYHHEGSLDLRKRFSEVRDRWEARGRKPFADPGW